MMEAGGDRLEMRLDGGKSIITLEPLGEEHDTFLYRLFIECRPDLKWITGVDERTKADIIRQQFVFENDQMKCKYPDAAFLAVALDGELTGRFYVDRGEEAYRIIAIGLLEAYRGAGLGTKLVKSVMDKAAAEGKRVRLRVAWFNRPAQAFYERLGFKAVADTGDGFEMLWTPEY